MRTQIFDARPDLAFGEKRYVESGDPLGSPEQQSDTRIGPGRCACGFKLRGPMHADGPHHRGNSTIGKRQRR